MKTTIAIFLGTLVLLITACKGSDAYRGAWKAMDKSGHKYDLVFEAEKLTVKDSTGKSEVYKYSQNEVNIQGSTETYGIVLEDGRRFKMNFPIANDESTGFMLDQNDVLMFTISRTKYINYGDNQKL